LLIGWGHHATGATPRCPKINQDRQMAAANVFVKVGFIEGQRMALKQGPMALTAIRRMSLIRNTHPVGGVAMRTNNVQGGS